MKLLYLDPGSGSLILQLVIAGLTGVITFLALGWRKIKRIFKKKEEDDE